MKTYISTLVIIGIACCVSCKRNMPLQARVYQNEDSSIVGGFTFFTLRLNSDGKLKLTGTSAIADGDSDYGGKPLILSKTISGKWTLNENAISCSFENSKPNIDSLFKEPEWKKVRTSEKLISFSEKSDTAFIYGIPCPLAGDKLRSEYEY